MKRGILAYRAAYPDIKFEVLCVSVAQHQYPHKAPVSDSSTTHGSSDGASSSMAGSDTAGSNSPSSGSGHASRAGGGAAMSRLMQQQDWFQLSCSQESRSSRAAACLCTGQPVAPTWGLSERLPRVGSRFPSQVGMSVRVCLDCVSG